MSNVFLKAQWRKLMMANYTVDPKLLTPYLPYGTEIDLWQNSCYVSLVGFMFLDTTVKGFRIPFHINFEEVNLRFYVRYKDKKEWKRGVVFIREIVPRFAITFIANAIYNEKYVTMPMKHVWKTGPEENTVEYSWRSKKWNTFKVITEKTALKIMNGSEEEFITEHYWGYTRFRNEKTSEYEVVHPKWEVYKIKEHFIDVDFGDVYGSHFDFLNTQTPTSVFLAEGSEVTIKSGKRF
jgi:uncharacterized protein YqjF (DUF2071 family)